ncbi:MAG: ATP synthase F0 subunit B [Desulfobacterales bacterium]|jgi:F-type H+-transporting ATPase subunit b|nr:ATP synthase F0 subunit B [Desulfobacterales bacterium]
MEIVSNIALISINETLIVQVVSFLILVFLLNRIMFRPLRRTVEERGALIDRIRKDIDQAEQALETVSAETKKRESAIKADAFEVQASLEASAQQEAGAVLKATSREMDAIRKKAEDDVTKMVDAAKANITEEAERLTVSIMEKMLDRRLAS